MDNKITQEEMVRAIVSESKGGYHFPIEATKDYSLDARDIIGWFCNSSNVFGWLLLKASDFDKQEFGNDVFRTYSSGTNTTNIIKLNIKTGTYAFIKSKSYEDGVVEFDRMSKYRNLTIDNSSVAFEEFNII